MDHRMPIMGKHKSIEYSSFSVRLDSKTSKFWCELDRQGETRYRMELTLGGAVQCWAAPQQKMQFQMTVHHAALSCKYTRTIAVKSHGTSVHAFWTN
jgi:hypothetical protein